MLYFIGLQFQKNWIEYLDWWYGGRTFHSQLFMNFYQGSKKTGKLLGELFDKAVGREDE